VISILTSLMPSLKPAACGPNRGRGRKRGLAEGREEGGEGEALSVTHQQCLELTQAAALSPVAGPGQGPATHLPGPALSRLQVATSSGSPWHHYYNPCTLPPC
jgi:hypothetical protein